MTIAERLTVTETLDALGWMTTSGAIGRHLSEEWGRMRVPPVRHISDHNVAFPSLSITSPLRRSFCSNLSNLDELDRLSNLLSLLYKDINQP